MERSARRSEFFKRLNILIYWERIEKKNKKNVSKSPGNKRQPAYSGIPLFKIILLSH
ncbi:MAG: hypothetical protein ACMUEL_09395 [Flavobacteriales bacterium Tduv]